MEIFLASIAIGCLVWENFWSVTEPNMEVVKNLYRSKTRLKKYKKILKTKRSADIARSFFQDTK